MFEWDEGKRKANLVKHGLDFADAIEVFVDALRIERINERRSHDEERREVIGRVHEHVLFVVYTPRGAVRRMISARRASRDERRAYLASRSWT